MFSKEDELGTGQVFHRFAELSEELGREKQRRVDLERKLIGLGRKAAHSDALAAAGFLMTVEEMAKVLRFNGVDIDTGGLLVSLCRNGLLYADDVEGVMPSRVSTGKGFVVCLLYTSPSPRD